jgi:peroxiredoxin
METVQRIVSATRPLGPGETAPDFTLASTPEHKLSLRDLRGRPVILAFYPADWSPVCGAQVSLYNDLLPVFARFGAALLAISVDDVWCHAAYARARKLRFPLLSDFEPKGEVARAYGVYRRNDGVCERALFVLSPSGAVYWSYVSPIAVNPGAEGILAALEGLARSQCDPLMKDCSPATSPAEPRGGVEGTLAGGSAPINQK